MNELLSEMIKRIIKRMIKQNLSPSFMDVGPVIFSVASFTTIVWWRLGHGSVILIHVITSENFHWSQNMDE